MRKTDINPPAGENPPKTASARRWGNDLLIAFALLTRLPVPHAEFGGGGRPAAHAAWAYPVVGLVVSVPAVVLGYICLALGIPAALCALIMITASIILTGAMHEDGVADCADGFWGGWQAPRRLEIMKDSAIGTYGVLALVAVVGAKWAALAAILSEGGPAYLVLFPAIASRSGMVWVMQALPNAREAGLSKQTGKPGWSATYIALALGAAALIFAPVPNMFWVAFAGILAICAAAALARNKIGGQTGDVLGATQSVSEAVLLVAISAQFA